MIEMTYTDHATGEVTVRSYPDDRLDELLTRADAKFCTAATPEEERRYQEIMAACKP